VGVGVGKGVVGDGVGEGVGVAVGEAVGVAHGQKRRDAFAIALQVPMPPNHSEINIDRRW
jgi:hypothetical protein